MNIGGKIFLGCLFNFVTGAIVFGVGMSAELNRAGNYSNSMMDFGAFLVAASCFIILCNAVYGTIMFTRHSLLEWWWPLSIFGALFALCGGFAVYNL